MMYGINNGTSIDFTVITFSKNIAILKSII